MSSLQDILNHLWTWIQRIWADKEWEWIFSGVGVALIAAIVRFLLRRRKEREQNIRAVDSSTNIQTGNGAKIIISSNQNPSEDYIQKEALISPREILEILKGVINKVQEVGANISNEKFSKNEFKAETEIFLSESSVWLLAEDWLKRNQSELIDNALDEVFNLYYS